MSKLAVTYLYTTGHLSHINSELRRALGQYARHNDWVKVGITNNPERRWKEHLRERAKDGDSWTRMVVIFETISWIRVGDAERRLEKYLREIKYNHKRWNEVGGGGGRVPEQGPYYLYLLLD